MKKLILLALLLLASRAANAQVINANSCSFADVNTALGLVTASTTQVNIPACPGGTAWTTAINFTVPAGSTTLSIIGAGNLSTTGGGDQTVIQDNIGDHFAVMNITTNATGFLRVAGLTFKAGSGTIKDDGFILISGPSSNVRVDHCHFNATTGGSEGTRGGVSTSDVYGVIDHNILDLGTPSEINGIVNTNPGAGSFGDETWAAATALGSRNFLFEEDNVFNGGASNDCQHGGRFVIRHNTLNTTSIQTHPTGGAGRGRGCRAWEFYGNTLNTSNSSPGPQFNAFFLSSGTGVIWGNSAPTGYEQFLTIHAMRKDSTTYGESGTPSGWGYCGTSSGLGGDGSHWDQTQGSSGYACLDQPGRGKGDMLQGQFPNACDQTTGCATFNGTWPNEALEPVYEWSDTWTAAVGFPNPYATVDAASALVEKNNQDYYLWCSPSSNTGCNSAFNGTQGVGSGTLSARSSSCTPLTAYFATDTNTLYQCATPNAWTAYYTPYTYPHPLTAGQTSGNPVAPPTDLTATVQ